jgi:hypothetical protein
MRAGGKDYSFLVFLNRHFLTDCCGVDRISSSTNLDPGLGTEEATLIRSGTREALLFIRFL